MNKEQVDDSISIPIRFNYNPTLLKEIGWINTNVFSNTNVIKIIGKMSMPNDIFSIEHRHSLLYKVFQEVKERFGYLRENDEDTYSYTSTTLQKVLC